MTDFVKYEIRDGIAVITIDDGKANAMSRQMIAAIHEALDKAERDNAVTIITGRTGIFSAGFDLKELGGSPESLYELLLAGSKLCTRLLMFPTPIIGACTGHAYPMGAFILLSCDYRIGIEGDFKLGMNEVMIGIAAPQYAMELARFRLSGAHLNRTAILGEMFDPTEAVSAGILDQVVTQDALMATAMQKARDLKQVNIPAHQMAKYRIRKDVVAVVKQVTVEDITLENAKRLLGG